MDKEKPFYWGRDPPADEPDLDAIAAEEQAAMADETNAARWDEFINSDPELLDMESLAVSDRKQRLTLDGKQELEDFLSLQKEIDDLTRLITFWSSPAKLNISDYQEYPKEAVASGDHDAQHISAPAKLPTRLNPDTGKPASLSPYEAAEWLIRNIGIVSAQGHLYFFDGRSYILCSKSDASKKILEACRSAVAITGQARFVKQVYELLTLEPQICRDDDLQRNIVALDDGILDLDSWQIFPHTSELFVTTRLDGSYRDGSHTDCPTFNTFLNSMTAGNAELQKRIWQVIGYLLVPDQSGKSFVLFQGVPNSGKSVLGNFIRSYFLGDVVSALEVNELGGNFTLSDLVGRKLCVDFDLPADPFTKRAVGRLKKLTGQDLLSSDVKFKDRVRFVCTAKLLFATNHAVLLPNDDAAFKNRLVVVPFAVSVGREQQDFHLPAKLKAERSAIIYRALLAYRELRETNYVFAGNFPPNVVLGDSKSVLDAISAFIAKRCRISEGSWTPTDSLYTAFVREYGQLCGEGKFSESFLRLCRTQELPVMKKRGRVKPSANPTYGFQNIEMKE